MKRRQYEVAAKRLGVMVTERQLETTPTFVSVLVKYGFIDKDRKLGKHEGWAEFRRVENDTVVTRIRERLRAEGKLVRSGSLFSSVAETQQALSTMSEDQLLRLRARLVLGDFRIGPEDNV